MADMTLEEALEAATVDEELISPVNEVLMINPETRSIHVPDSEKLFGVRQDMSVERKYFKCPRIVGDNIDLFEHYVFVNYIPSDQNGKYESEKDVQGYWCKDLAVEGDFITFSWELTENVLQKAGYIAFAVYAKVSDENGNLKTKWHTTIAIGNVLDTLPDGEEWITIYPDIVTQLLERMDAVEKIANPESMQKYVDDYFNRNPMMIDRELKDETKAAPADIVGKLSEEKVNGIGITSIRAIKQADYDALEIKDSKTLYIISDATGTDTPEIPDEPENPDATLTNLTVTYMGGSVTVGTALEDLTGITVTAIYSDGSTKNVTEYGLSGTIGIGENTITVSYGGKTATFKVTGVALPTTYTVTNNLSHISTNNNNTSVFDGNNYTAILTADTDYNIDSVTVTMGGVDVTATVYSNGTINISNVTGNIVITAVATTSLVAMPYIMGDGASYIDTDYIPPLDFTYEVTFKDFDCTNNYGVVGVWGSGFLGEGNTWTVALHHNKRIAYKMPNVNNTLYTIKRTPTELFVNGESVGTVSAASNVITKDPLRIFGATINTNFSTCKFYSLKLWEGDTLVHDFVAKKDTSGVACVYDNVTGEYKYNEGTGTLTYGESLEVA